MSKLSIEQEACAVLIAHNGLVTYDKGIYDIISTNVITQDEIETLRKVFKFTKFKIEGRADGKFLMRLYWGERKK